MTETAKIETRDITPTIPDAGHTPMAMIERAISQDASIETLEKLMALQERHEANHARRAFDMAIAAAKAEIPPIVKNATVDFTSKKGRTNYKHETLDGIARVVDPVLSKFGLSYRFRSAQNERGLTVICRITHRDGHAEETSLSGPPDQSGSKNAFQAVGSAATYLQRYTLKLALGLSAATDDDAQGANVPDFLPEPAAERILDRMRNAESYEDLQRIWSEEADTVGQIGKANRGLGVKLYQTRDDLKTALPIGKEDHRQAFNQQSEPSVADDIAMDSIPY